MDQPLPSKDRFPSSSPANPWRFSLREFLLAVTAIGALLALAVKSVPARPTPFFDQFDAQRELQLVCKELGVKLGSSGGGSSSSWGGGSGRKRWDFASHQDQRPLGEIATALADRVEADLDRQGCTIMGRGTTGDRKRKQLQGFSYSYQRGGAHGEFVCEFVDLPDGHFRVYVFCVEFTKR